jgi:hypothetical protein
MKNCILYTAVAVFLLALAGALCAQEPEKRLILVDESGAVKTEADDKDAVTFLFSEGVIISRLNRITKQTGRSNFVLEDLLAGIYIGAEMRSQKIAVPVVRVSLYYPLESTFNKMPQKPNTPLHYGADVFTGLSFGFDKFKYVTLHFGPGLHLFFLNSDRWNYLDAGVVAFAGIEAPLNRYWTLLINGSVSLDNGNLGANRNIEPFDIVYQYHLDLGIRYNKKLRNDTYLLMTVGR